MLKKGQKYTKRIDWQKAPDIKLRIKEISKSLKIDWPDGRQVHCVRSKNANTRAYARIWGLARIWQETLNLTPSYIIEVISEKFDKLSDAQKDKVLLHELAHIPKNFSGALIPHTRRRKGSFREKFHALHGKLEKLYGNYRLAR